MSDADDELLPLSGVQHVIFCPRQAALIHVERIWLENAPTALGRILHERADLPGRDTQRGVRLGRAVQLRSLRLGLYGVADVVEYHDDPSVPGGTRPYSVEYKRGIKLRLADQVQLCAHLLLKRNEEAFRFDGRSRRPLRDRVNALLSFGYALLMQDCAAAASGVGLDPAVAICTKIALAGSGWRST